MDIEKAICEKFVFLVGPSAMTTATRLPIGPIYPVSDPPSRRLLIEVMQKVVAAGRAKGIQLNFRYAENRLALCDSLLADLTSSMHKDLQRGSRLEVDWLSGSVVRLRKPLFIPTPVNEVIACLVAPLAAGSR